MRPNSFPLHLFVQRTLSDIWQHCSLRRPPVQPSTQNPPAQLIPHIIINATVLLLFFSKWSRKKSITTVILFDETRQKNQTNQERLFAAKSWNSLCCMDVNKLPDCSSDWFYFIKTSCVSIEPSSTFNLWFWPCTLFFFFLKNRVNIRTGESVCWRAKTHFWCCRA